MAESMATPMLSREPAMLDPMTTCTAFFRSLVPCIALLLVSCGSTRHTVSPGADELTGFVLIMGEDPDGQVRHSWQRATELNLPRYDPPSSVGRIVLASRRPRDCDQEQVDCVQACMKRRLPSNYSHIRREDGGKKRFCEKECLEEYMDCLESQKQHALQFNAVDSAVEWLKRNREQLLLGSVVIIAGVAFVTISAGAGAVVLAPIVLVAT
ncbi:hypothetical protein [Archangium gephyra]|uniref:hypothetical protein n=1 Tax=Archangium gephyra TaxID=48 RepID=UPI003B98585C